MAKKNSPEYDIQVETIDWLIEEYPGVVFRSDLGGIRLPPGLAQKVTKLNRGSGKRVGRKVEYLIPRQPFPDLFLYEQRKGYGGCAIELKKDPWQYKYKRTGDIKLNNEHIGEQYEMLSMLRLRNFYADFAGGMGEIKSLIRWYLDDTIVTKYWPYSAFHTGGG